MNIILVVKVKIFVERIQCARSFIIFFVLINREHVSNGRRSVNIKTGPVLLRPPIKCA